MSGLVLGADMNLVALANPRIDLPHATPKTMGVGAVFTHPHSIRIVIGTNIAGCIKEFVAGLPRLLRRASVIRH